MRKDIESGHVFGIKKIGSVEEETKSQAALSAEPESRTEVTEHPFSRKRPQAQEIGHMEGKSKGGVSCHRNFEKPFSVGEGQGMRSQGTKSLRPSAEIRFHRPSEQAMRPEIKFQHRPDPRRPDRGIVKISAVGQDLANFGSPNIGRSSETLGDFSGNGRDRSFCGFHLSDDRLSI